MHKYLFVILIIASLFSCEKDLTSQQLLEKTIAYHDPNNLWNSFNSDFHVTMETPDSPNRESDITINIPESAFYMKAVRETTMIEYKIKGNNCNIALNGNSHFTEEEAKAQFGFLMNAFEYGAPPHGGIAFGLDRLVAILGGQETIRDFIAFPKNNSGRDVMINSPSKLDAEQLKELSLKINS